MVLQRVCHAQRDRSTLAWCSGKMGICYHGGTLPQPRGVTGDTSHACTFNSFLKPFGLGSHSNPAYFCSQ